VKAFFRTPGKSLVRVVLVLPALTASLYLAAQTDAATASWSLSPTNFDFGAVQPGSGPTAPSILTLTNTGETELPVPDVALQGLSYNTDEGNPPARFQSTNRCSVLPVGASCPIEVTFEALAPGARETTLHVTDPGMPELRAALRGVGIGPVVSFSPPELSLPSRPLGIELNPPGVLTVDNSGDSDLVISEISFQGLGSNPNGFGIVGGTCTPGSLVPAGGSCTVQVTYTPRQAGYFLNAELTIVDNGLHGNQIVEVVGGGVGEAPGMPALKTTYISRRPRAKTTSRMATFRFAVEGGGLPFVCKLDGGPFRPCRSPRSYRHLAIGPHVFRVKPGITGPGIWAGAAIARFRVIGQNPDGQHFRPGRCGLLRTPGDC
jgi:hypothetical protein